MSATGTSVFKKCYRTQHSRRSRNKSAINHIQRGQGVDDPVIEIFNVDDQVIEIFNVDDQVIEIVNVVILMAGRRRATSKVLELEGSSVSSSGG